jgi:hypothetical protein
MEVPERLKHEKPVDVEGGCPKCGHPISAEAVSCPACGGKLGELLAIVQMQAELNRIDLEWERERKKYMISVEGETPSTPGSRTSVFWVSLIWILLNGIGGVYFWTVGDNDSMACCAIFGVVGIFVGLWSYGKAHEYEHAEAAYRRRRRQAEERYGGQAKTEDD